MRSAGGGLAPEMAWRGCANSEAKLSLHHAHTHVRALQNTPRCPRTQQTKERFMHDETSVQRFTCGI